MPVVFVPGKGNIQFPDNMTPYQITLAIEREILPNRKPDTISAPKQPEATLWNSIKGIGTSLGAGWDYLKATAQDISAGDLAELASGQKGVGAAIDSIIPDIYGPDRAERAARAARFGNVAARTPEKQAALSARAAAEAAAPNIESPVGRMAYSAASSLAQMAPGLVGSVVTGNPIPALANIGAITFPEAYQRYDERGATPQEALTGAVAETGIELGTEMLPLGAVVNKLGKVGFGKFLKEFLGKELIGEEIATITQGAIDTAIANPDKTWGEYVKELPMQMVETAGSTLLTGGALAGAGAIAKRVTGAQEPTEEAPAAKRAAAPPPPPPPPADFAQKLGAVGSKIILKEPGGINEYTYRGMDEDGRVIIEAEDGSVFAEDPAEINAAIDVGAVVPTEPDETPLPGVAFGEEEVEPAPTVAPEPEPAPVTVPEPEGKPLSRFIAEFEEPAGKPISSFTAEPGLAPVPAPAPTPAPSKPGPMPLPLAKDAKDIIGEYSQDRSTEDLQQIMSIASDLARQYGKRSITKDVLFKAGQRFDGIPPVEAPQAAAKPEEKFAVTLPTKPEPATDFGPDLKRIMGLFHPSIREGFRLPEIKKGIEEGAPFKASDLPGALYKNLNPADRKIMEQALIENPQQVLDAAQITPFKTPKGEVVRNTSSDTGADLPIDESNLKSMKEMQRTRTPAFMADLEKEARQIASNEGASSVSSLHFAEALNNSASRLNGRKVPFAGDWRESLSEAFNEPKERPKAAPAPAAPRAVGKKANVTIPATRNKVEVQDELLDLADVKFAEGELQNRDRSRPQTQQFLRRFTSEFDPEGLGEDRSTDRGAPIINKDNVILSGNGRTMGLEEIYEKHPEQAEKYRQFLRDNGWDIEGIERPFLARRLLSDVDEREFVTGSNEADIAALSPPEQAAQDAQDILKPAVMAKYNGGDLNASKNDAFISAFLAEMSPQQRENAMDDKGKVSAQALKRIENALLYKAYGQAGRASDVFISKAMERSSDDTKTLTNSLVDVAKDWIKFQQAVKNGEIDKKYDITGKLMETVGTVSDIKASGNSLSGELRSPDMVNPMDPFGRDILLSFHDDKTFRILSKKAIAEKIRAYTEVAANQQPEPDMFGKAETPSARAIWKRVDAGEGAPQVRMFAPNQPTVPNFWQQMFDDAEKIPSLSLEIKKLTKLHDEGKIDDVDFAREVKDVQWFVSEMRDAKRLRDADEPRLRGADRIREVVLAAKRRGDITEDAADLAEWFALRNPHLIDNLGISVIKESEGVRSPFYTPFDRIMHLIKGASGETSAVHEIMHHLERMMPEPIRKAIKASWAKELDKAEADRFAGRNRNDDLFFKALRAFHAGEKVKINGENLSPSDAFDFAKDLLSSGRVDGRFYQYVNPSEFWAVNATEIMKGRYDVQGSLLGRLRNWLRELSTKIKGIFKLDSKAPIIKALDSLEKGDGKFVSDKMLEEKLGKFGEGPPEKAQNASSGSIVGGTEVDIDAFRGRNFEDLLTHIASNRDGKYSDFDSRLADRLEGLLGQLQTAGADVKLFIVRKGDSAPSSIATGNARGMVETDLKSRDVKVYLRSPNIGNAGNTTETILHEGLHAVSSGVLLAVENGRGTPEMIQFRKDLIDLRNKVINHFNARVKKLGKAGLTEFELSMYERRNNAFKDIDEFLTWGLTNKMAQDYLRSIDAGPKKSLFNKFVDAFRSMLGISPNDTSALAHLIDVINPLFETTAEDYRTTFYQEAAPAAPPPPPVKSATPPATTQFGKGNQGTFNFLRNGSPAEMKKAIAKAQEPDNKIMDERADIQKKNRGCD